MEESTVKYLYDGKTVYLYQWNISHFKIEELKTIIMMSSIDAVYKRFSIEIEVPLK